MTNAPAIEQIREIHQYVLTLVGDVAELKTRTVLGYDRIKALEDRVIRLESVSDKLDLNDAREDGQKSVFIWIGGLAVAFLSAIGTVIFQAVLELFKGGVH